MRPASSTPTAVVLIDIQEGITQLGSELSTPSFESNVTNLLRTIRAYNEAQPGSPATHPIHIIHIHHHSKNPASTLHPSNASTVAPLSYATPLPSEPVIIKDVNSSFIGTDLEARIRRLGIRQLIFAGLVTDHCVSTTVRMAANLKVLGDDTGSYGDGIIVLRDATATFAKGTFDAETVHAVNLASLDGEFAKVQGTDEVIDQVIGRSV